MENYGILDERGTTSRLTTSILLCDVKGKRQLILRTVGKARLAASVNYTYIEATPEAVRRLAKIILGVQERISQDDRTA